MLGTDVIKRLEEALQVRYSMYTHGDGRDGHPTDITALSPEDHISLVPAQMHGLCVLTALLAPPVWRDDPHTTPSAAGHLCF